MINFTTMEYASKLLQQAVEEIAHLPGIGPRTAMRLVLHLLRQPESGELGFVRSNQTAAYRNTILSNLATMYLTSPHVAYVPTQKGSQLVCVVEDVRDVIAVKALLNLQGFTMC